MRLFPTLLSAAGALAASAAIAQTNSSEPPARGLPGLQTTVQDLQDQPAADEPAPSGEAEAPARSAAAPPPRSAPALPTAEGAALTAASQRGQQLNVLARAGQLATRDMLGRIADPEAAGIVGWVAEPEGNAIEVIFYARGASGPVAVYRGSVLGGRIVSPRVFEGAERIALNPIEARMAAARDATDALTRASCGSAPFNVLVIPPVTPIAPVDVYQLTPPTEEEHLPIGGHYKATVGPDGTVGQSTSFGDCQSVVIPPAAPGQRPPPIELRRASTPLPTELDVFLSLQAGRVLRVVAGEPPRTFLVAGDRIAVTE